jgi:hypothetical protein
VVVVVMVGGVERRVYSGWWHEVFTVHGVAVATNTFLAPSAASKLRATLLHLASPSYSRWRAHAGCGSM